MTTVHKRIENIPQVFRSERWGLMSQFQAIAYRLLSVSFIIYYSLRD